jgi:hypothetical protein
MTTTHPADLAVERRLGAEQPHLSRLDLLRLLAARFPRGAAPALEPEVSPDHDLEALPC